MNEDVVAPTPPEGTLPHVRGAVASLAWAALGPVFASEAAHFGPGFAFLNLWYLSIPVITLALFGATVYKVNTYLEGDYGTRASRLAVSVWPVASLAYLALGLYLLIA